MKNRPHDNKWVVETVLSIVLLAGLLAALAVTTIGGGLLMIQQGDTIISFQFFKEESASLSQLDAIVTAALAGDAHSITQLGILMMIATPIARVLSCAILFLFQRDRLYVALSTFVLAILLFSFFSHL